MPSRTAHSCPADEPDVSLAATVIRYEINDWATAHGMKHWPIVDTAVKTALVSYALGTTVQDAIVTAKELVRTTIGSAPVANHR